MSKMIGNADAWLYFGLSVERKFYEDFVFVKLTDKVLKPIEKVLSDLYKTDTAVVFEVRCLVDEKLRERA